MHTPEEQSLIEKLKWFKRGGEIIPKADHGLKLLNKIYDKIFPDKKLAELTDKEWDQAYNYILKKYGGKESNLLQKVRDYHFYAKNPINMGSELSGKPIEYIHRTHSKPFNVFDFDYKNKTDHGFRGRGGYFLGENTPEFDKQKYGPNELKVYLKISEPIHGSTYNLKPGKNDSPDFMQYIGKHSRSDTEKLLKQTLTEISENFIKARDTFLKNECPVPRNLKAIGITESTTAEEMQKLIEKEIKKFPEEFQDSEETLLSMSMEEYLGKRSQTLKANSDFLDERLKSLGIGIESSEEEIKSILSKPLDTLIPENFDSIDAYMDNYEIVSYNPKNIKFSQAITRDDSGNVIPLSKRDDFTNEDMRYKKGGTLKLQEGGSIREYQEEFPDIQQFRHLLNEYVAQDFDNDLYDLFNSGNIKYGQLDEEAEKLLTKKYNLSPKQLKETLEDLINSGNGQILIEDLVTPIQETSYFKNGGIMLKYRNGKDLVINTLNDAIASSKRIIANEGTTRSEKLTKKISDELTKKEPGASKPRVKKTPELLDQNEVDNISNTILAPLQQSSIDKAYTKQGLTPETKTFEGFLLSGTTLKVSEDLTLKMQKAASVTQDPKIEQLSKIVTAAYQSETQLPQEFVKDLQGILTGTNFSVSGKNKANVYWGSASITSRKKQELLECFDTIKSGQYELNQSTCDRLQRNGQKIVVGNKDILGALRRQFNTDTPAVMDAHTKFALDPNIAPVTDEEYELATIGIIPERFQVSTLDPKVLAKDSFGAYLNPQAYIWQQGDRNYQRAAVIRRWLADQYPGRQINFATDYQINPKELPTDPTTRGVVLPVKTSWASFTDTSGKTKRLVKKSYYQTDEFGDPLLDEKGAYIYGATTSSSAASPRKTVFTVDGYNTNIPAFNVTPNRRVSQKKVAQAEANIRQLAAENEEFFLEYTQALREENTEEMVKLAHNNEDTANALLKELAVIDDQEMYSKLAGQVHHLDELTMQAAKLLVENHYDVEKSISAYPEKRKQFEYLRDMILLPQEFHTGPTESAHNYSGVATLSNLGEGLGLTRLGVGTDPDAITQNIVKNNTEGLLTRLQEFKEKTVAKLTQRRSKAQTINDTKESKMGKIESVEEQLQSMKRKDTKKYAKKTAYLAKLQKELEKTIQDYNAYTQRTESIKQYSLAGIQKHFDVLDDNVRNVLNQLVQAKQGTKLIYKKYF